MISTNSNLIALSFIAFLLLMVLVGVLSTRKAKSNSEDYLLAGRGVHPWVMALSMLSTNYSGFMFIGYIGYTYNQGISSIWYLLTWALGDLIAWLTIHKKLRDRSAELGATTISSFLGISKRGSQRSVIVLASLLSFIFLGVYAAAQLKVSSKALYSLLGWDSSVAIIVAGVIVAVYCFSGGIRASIWTDVVQTILMCTAMVLLLIIAVTHCGGLQNLFASLQTIDPNLTELIPPSMQGHFVIFLISLMFNGYGVIGQPHIMIRPMAIDDSRNMNQARNIYFICYLIFGFAALGVGLASRILMPEMVSLDSELTLPYLSIKLLPEILVGLILAGIFSAAISTADSQILSCSASLTQDLMPHWKKSYMASKFATLFITTLAVLIALYSSQSVFDLVLAAWAVLAACIGPLLFLKVFAIKVKSSTAISMMCLALLTVLVWRYVLGWNEFMHEAMPGILVAVLTWFAMSKLDK